MATGCGSGGDELTVVSAKSLAAIEKSPLIEGRDGGASAYAFGRSVWTFGDTVINIADDHGQSWHHNSVSWTSDMDARDGITAFTEPLEASGAPRHFIPPSPDELEFNLAHFGDDCGEPPCGARWAIWPGHPVWDAERSRALVFYSLIYAEPGDFNFASVGASVATWSALGEIPERPVVDPSAEHPDLLWGEDEPNFGVGSVIDGEYVYTFSCDEPGDGHPCKIARARAANPTMRAAWEYYDGSSWAPEVSDAKKLFEGAPIISCSYRSYLGSWLTIYTHPFEHTIVARSAPELTGPWSDETVLYTVPDEDAPYDALHHPEYDHDGGRLTYISYSRPTTGWFGRELVLVEVTFENPDQRDEPVF